MSPRLFLKKFTKSAKYPSLFLAANLLAACSGAGAESVTQTNDQSTFSVVEEVAPTTMVQAVAKAPPNILLILADDMGYSDIGAFGGEIETPNLDKLAARGRILTNYHTSALCAVTRSMLMTGTDHHLVGQGSMEIRATDPRFGKPGYEDLLNEAALPIAQLFKDNGYHTYMAGKWQLGIGVAPEKHGPEDKGFEKAFSFNADHPLHWFNPATDYTYLDENGKAAEHSTFDIMNDESLVEKDTVAKDATVEAKDHGFVYASDLYTRKLIKNIKDGITADTKANQGKTIPDEPKPFFAYLAFHTPHAPMQAPAATIKKYTVARTYRDGFNVVRNARLKKQKDEKLLPQDFQPAPLVTKWEDLSQDKRDVSTRSMEIYAAMIDNLDKNVGHVINFLKNTGQLENTLIVFHSDNGAQGKDVGGQLASFTKNAKTKVKFLEQAGAPAIADKPLKDIEKISYGRDWGTVSNTPFSGYKGELLEGGTSSPTILVLPGEQEAKRPNITALVHVTDLAPTLLEAAGIAVPGAAPDLVHADHKRIPKIQYNGKSYFPITGKSLLGWLKDDSKTEIIHDTPVFDELNSRAYVKTDEWKALWNNDTVKWELFDISTDRAELKNVDKKAKLKNLVKDWEEYQTLNGVIKYGCNWPTAADELDESRTPQTCDSQDNEDDPND